MAVPFAVVSVTELVPSVTLTVDCVVHPAPAVPSTTWKRVTVIALFNVMRWYVAAADVRFGRNAL
jgi:hypothetical protein